MDVITNDCDFPHTVESMVYSIIWKSMLDESLRELDYMADLAGMNLDLSIMGDYISFKYLSYNTKVEKFMTKMFSLIEDFPIDKTFFDNLLSKTVRNYKNHLTIEPY